MHAAAMQRSAAFLGYVVYVCAKEANIVYVSAQVSFHGVLQVSGMTMAEVLLRSQEQLKVLDQVTVEDVQSEHQRRTCRRDDTVGQKTVPPADRL